MENNLLDAALSYAERGFSIIPIRPDKKPFIKWEAHQKEKATLKDIREWWVKWPNANVGIVTGPISGILVIDCDNEDAYRKLQELLPDSFLTCIVKSPRGYHLYLVYPKDQTISNAAGVMPGVDVRGEGGYIISPPSINAEGKSYAWIPGLAPGEIEPAPVPESLYKYISLYTYRGCKENVRPGADSLQFLTKGTRDNDLFHVGNCLIKGGCKEEIARQVLVTMAL